MEKLRIYINYLDGPQQIAFADSCDTTIGYLRKAISDGQLLNPKTCVKIEKNSNFSVTRKDLRPDDWVEFWPELAKAA